MERDMTRLLTAVLLILVMACTGDKAKELLETAEFEERQMNIPHAKQLYEDVIRLYPSSQEADKARARLANLSRS
jgi:TolA-binding protein